jgi:hypothetical protein
MQNMAKLQGVILCFHLRSAARLSLHYTLRDPHRRRFRASQFGQQPSKRSPSAVRQREPAATVPLDKALDDRARDIFTCDSGMQKDALVGEFRWRHRWDDYFNRIDPPRRGDQYAALVATDSDIAFGNLASGVCSDYSSASFRIRSHRLGGRRRRTLGVRSKPCSPYAIPPIPPRRSDPHG